MTKTIIGYTIILISIAGLVLPIPGLILLTFVGLNLISEDGGTRFLRKLKERRPFDRLLSKIEI